MFKSIMTLVAAIALGAVVTHATLSQAQDAPAGAPQAMPISVATVLSREVTEWKVFSGRLRAVEDVEIRARVSGAIEAVHFKEGDIVEKGSKLFTIDPRPYQAALKSAKAQHAAAKARAELAWNEFKRAKSLYEQKAYSQREFEEKQNAHRDAEAAVNAADAQRDLAELDLEYAEVRAPITGRVGRADITAGNMIQAGMNVLTTMQSITPIYADFDVDEQTYLRLMKTVRADNKLQDMPVFMALADETDYPRQGVIRAFDNQLKADTGTIRVRAEFDNADGYLTPGLFASIRLGSATKQVKTVINDSAIGTDQSKRFVYTVDAKGTVGYRPVTLGTADGMMRVIESGLAAGENIIVNGLLRVHPGMKVAPMMVSMETLQPIDPPPADAGVPPAAPQ